MDRNWAGQGPVRVRAYETSLNADIHRIKVDEEVGILITTHRYGGLSVTDIKTDQVLWALENVRPYAHCEYDNGFLVFDRFGSCKEVWRLASDDALIDPPTTCRPDEDQLNAAREADSNFSIDSKGRFRPWALINMSDVGRAFRFVYPTLAVATLGCVYLWDIPSARLVEAMGGIQALHLEANGTMFGDINYVDLNEQYVFLCGSSGFRLLRRNGGALALALLSSHAQHGKCPVVLDEIDLNVVDSSIPAPRVLPINMNADFGRGLIRSPHEFIAAHVSPCGRHLAILSSDNRLLLFQDFERVVKEPALLSEVVLEVRLTRSDKIQYSVYLTFGPERVSVVSTAGIFIFTLDSRAHLLLPDDRSSELSRTTLGLIRNRPSLNPNTSFPYLSASYLTFSVLRLALAEVSCLQMTERRLYFTWSSDYVPEEVSDMESKSEDASTEEHFVPAEEDDVSPEEEGNHPWGGRATEREIDEHGTLEEATSSPRRDEVPYMVDDGMWTDDEDGGDEEEYDDISFRGGTPDDESGVVACCVDFGARS